MHHDYKNMKTIVDKMYEVMHSIMQHSYQPGIAMLEADPEVTSRLTQEEIDEIFNPTYYTKRVDEIFERIGLGD